MQILIVKLGSIGDVVHTLPSLAAIRAAVPAAQISWAVEPRSAEILRGSPMIDRLVEVDTRRLRRARLDSAAVELRSQVRELRSTRYDIAIDFQGLIKSGAICKLSGAVRRWGFDRLGLREPASRVFLTDTAATRPGVSVICKNLALAGAAVGFDPSAAELAFPISTGEAHRAEAAAIAARTGPRFALLNPAGGWATKLWPAENYAALARSLSSELSLPSVVVTGPGEEPLAARVREMAGNANVTFASPSLKGFYELARLASVYVGGDTGPTHLAVAAGAPVVGLFGPTEWWRNGSPRPDDICVERTDIGCRVDCHRRRCSNWICMDIEVERVAAAVAERIERAERSAAASKLAV
ncbi:MAG: lipopolysaccharide heptosyltransferase I [Pyrinomonadaceae bacterium]